MNRLFPLLLYFFFVSMAYSQRGVNYNDVVLVVNSNSDTSQVIANYFALKRSIPVGNIVTVDVTTDEEVSDSVFRDYAGKIKAYLIAHDLQDTINYIVTTKGCPLKVNRATLDCQASAESELMLMTASYEDYYVGDCISTTDINTGNFLQNPYYTATDSFFKLAYQIYLVTRLDAYTVQDVLDMIDNGGPNTYVDKDSVLFVLDQSPNWSGDPLNVAMVTTSDTLTSRGWNVLLNRDSVYVTNQKNVLGYVSWGSNDGYSDHYTANAIPNNTWAKGAIAETHVSTSARSLQTETTYGQSLIADWIHEGVSGIKGYVYEPFTVAIARSNILFDRYTDLRFDGSPKFNLAQSYFAASRMIGWMDLVVGDPKTSITTNLGLSNAIHEAPTSSSHLFPNPAQEQLNIVTSEKAYELKIYSMTGQLVATFSRPDDNIIQIGNLVPAVYLAELKSGNKAERIRWIKL